MFPASLEYDSMPHATTTHLLTIQALLATKLGFLSLALPLLLPTKLGFLSLPHLPLISFQQNIPMVAHSAPTEVSHLQQIHTQALAKNHNLSSIVCLQTPAPPLSHPYFLPFCKSRLTSTTHNLLIPLPHRFYTPISWL